MIWGYARVSTREQNEARQIIALTEAGVDRKAIFLDKQSGKDFDRPGYHRLLRKLKPGDVLVIESIDRLGRNYEEILDEWRMITKKEKAAIVVLDMPLLDTRERKQGDLTGAFVADLVLQILAYVAQTEREFNKKRQAEGIAAAKARGVRFGRSRLQRTEKHEKALREYRAGLCSSREAAAYCGVSHTTIDRWAKEEEAKDDAGAS